MLESASDAASSDDAKGWRCAKGVSYPIRLMEPDWILKILKVYVYFQISEPKCVRSIRQEHRLKLFAPSACAPRIVTPDPVVGQMQPNTRKARLGPRSRGRYLWSKERRAKLSQACRPWEARSTTRALDSEACH